MKLTPLTHNHFRVSDADAAKLARGAGAPPHADTMGSLPRVGYEVKVTLPNGKKAWLKRDHVGGSNKRGWVWCVYSSDRLVWPEDKQNDGTYKV